MAKTMTMGKDGFPIFPSGLSPAMAAKVRTLRAEFDGAKQIRHNNTPSKRSLMSRQETKDAALEKFNKATEDLKKITADATRLYNEITADVIFPETGDVPMAEPSHAPSDTALSAYSNPPGVSGQHVQLSREELQQMICCAATAATVAVHNAAALQRQQQQQQLQQQTLALQDKVEQDLREALIDEVDEEVRDELRVSLRNEVIEELKEDEELHAEASKGLKTDMNSDGELISQIQEEIEEDIKSKMENDEELISKIRAEIKAELTHEQLGPQIRQTIKNEMRADTQLMRAIRSEVKKEERAIKRARKQK